MPIAHFQLTEDDVATAARHDRALRAKESLRGSRLGHAVEHAACAFAGLWIVQPIFTWLFASTPMPWPTMIALAAWFGVLDYWRFWTGAAETRLSQYRSYPMARAPMAIDWDEAGINSNPLGAGKLGWRGLEKWSEVDGMMLIYARPKTYTVFPARAFGEGERALMQSYLSNAHVPEAGRHWWTGTVEPVRAPVVHYSSD